MYWEGAVDHLQSRYLACEGSRIWSPSMATPEIYFHSWWHLLQRTGILYNLSDWEQYEFIKGHTSSLIAICAKQQKLLHMMKRLLGDGCGVGTKCNTCFVSIGHRQHSMLDSDYEVTADRHAWCGLLDGAYNNRHWHHLAGLVKACLLFTGLKPGL